MKDQIELLTAECARLEKERDEAKKLADTYLDFCRHYRGEIASQKVWHSIAILEARLGIGKVTN